MPLDSASLVGNCQFSLTKTVTGFADLTQGTNQVLFGGVLDTAVWNQTYAAILPIDSGDSTEIDLSSFTNLANESVTLTSVVGIVVKVAPRVAANTDVVVKLSGDVTNGLDWFTAGAERIVLRNNGSFALLEDPLGAGVTVDGTHKKLLVESTGTDDADVTVVVIGAS